MRVWQRFFASIVVVLFLFVAKATATDIQIQSSVISNWQSKTTPIYLRIFNDPFTDNNGVFHPGGPNSYTDVPLTVNTVAKTLTIPSITMVSTDNALDNKGAMYHASIVDSRGRQIQLLEGLDNFFVPSTIASIGDCTPIGTCGTWADIRLANSAPQSFIDRFTYTDRVIDMKLAAIGGEGISSLLNVPFITSTPTNSLNNEFGLSTLGNGILKTVLSNGTLNLAVPGTDFETPIFFSAPLTRAINTVSIPKATSTVNGYLASTDWAIFNSKLPSFNGRTGAITLTSTDVTDALTFTPERILTINSPLTRVGNTLDINEAALSVGWSQITGIPSIFAPSPHASSHNLGGSDVIAPDWSQIANKPSAFTPSAHVHTATDITSGEFAIGRIPNLDAAKIATGVFNPDRLGTGTRDGTKFLRDDGSWQTVSGGGGGSGTVTSVGLAAATIFDVSNSPITTSGTLILNLEQQAANTVFAGPSSGSAMIPTFRSLVAADIPSLDVAKITSGVFSTARLGSGAANSTVFLRGDGAWSVLPNFMLNIDDGQDTNFQGKQNNHVIKWSATNTEWFNGFVAYSELTGVPSTFAPSAHNHAASDTNSGIFAVGRLGSGTATATNFLRGDGSWATVAYSNLSGVPSTFTPAAHTHSAADTTSGVFSPSRLATGTPDGTKFLRDDGTWQTVSGGGTPGGSPTQIQWNNAGAFAGSANLVWDNTNSIITINGLIRVNALWTAITTKTATYTITTSDNVILFSATATANLPSAASCLVSGRSIQFVIKNISSSGTITVDPNSAELIEGASTASVAPGQSITIITDGTSWYVI